MLNINIFNNRSTPFSQFTYISRSRINESYESDDDDEDDSQIAGISILK